MHAPNTQSNVSETARLFRCHFTVVLLAACLASAAWADPPVCDNTIIRLADDYAYLVGSADYSDADGDEQYGSTYRWLINGGGDPPAPVAELIHLTFDETTAGGGGEIAQGLGGVGFVESKWGYALTLDSPQTVSYSRQNNLNLSVGTIEMWIAPRIDPNDPNAPYHDQRHHLLYCGDNSDYCFFVGQNESGALYLEVRNNGQWQGAHNGNHTMHDWAGLEWHHIACTFSDPDDSIRFYVDGVEVADQGGNGYDVPPIANPNFYVGGSSSSHASHYAIDDVRIHEYVLSGEVIAAHARRNLPPLPHEVWFDTDALEIGDTVVFEFTPVSEGESGDTCSSDATTFPGVQITDPTPPSTLLPANSSEFTLTVHTIAATECRYSVGVPLDFADMTPFDTGAGTTQHTTVIPGVDTNPNTVTDVYVRCAADHYFLLHERYRCLPDANPSFPRTGNLWGKGFIAKGMPYCARIDLWMGAQFSPEQIRELRPLNPDIQVLTSINAIDDRDGLPGDYYIYGASDDPNDPNDVPYVPWPGTKRLNMTKDYVAEYKAHKAVQQILDSGLMFDGCFFDNVMFSPNWRDFHPDADGDGEPDDWDEFNAAWRAGLLHELETFRELMPHALMTGHAMHLADPNVPDIFNATSIGFWAPNVIEGLWDFSILWNLYEDWNTLPIPPHFTMIESAPPNEITYGYGYDPAEDTPPETLEFARTYYPYMRFGLALSLMQDGYFAHAFGDVWHGNDWWYDELDFDLGYPLGPAEFVYIFVGGEDVIEGGGFEDDPNAWPWELDVNTGAGCEATVTQDTDNPIAGSASARIDITAISDEDSDIDFAQWNRSLEAGVRYKLRFLARATFSGTIRVAATRGEGPLGNLGLSEDVSISIYNAWEDASFVATETTDNARIQFIVGQETGSVWLDGVELVSQPQSVVRRDYTNGVALLNQDDLPATIDLGPGYKRLTIDDPNDPNDAPKAALHEYILDDTDSGFSTVGDWTEEHHDSGSWNGTPPFFHDWDPECYTSGGAPTDEARWDLAIPAADTYTIAAWWVVEDPNDPFAVNWSQDALFEVVANKQVVASATFDQTTDGDKWHEIAEVALAPADEPYVRLTSQDGAPCVADALHIRSAARYNDGSPAATVTLQPMDGVILERVLGDLDGDGDTDADDFSAFAACLTGPDLPISPGCAPADFDFDTDADMTDFTAFQRTASSP